MSGTAKMRALSGGHTVTTSAAIAELVGGNASGTTGNASGTSAGRTPAERPGLKAKDWLG